MADHGVDCSMSRSGSVWDNAPIDQDRAYSTQNVPDPRSSKSSRLRLHRVLLQSETQALDNRLYEPCGVRDAGRISLGTCQRNRVQATPFTLIRGEKDSTHCLPFALNLDKNIAVNQAMAQFYRC